MAKPEGTSLVSFWDGGLRTWEVGDILHLSSTLDPRDVVGSQHPPCSKQDCCQSLSTDQLETVSMPGKSPSF